MAPGEVFGLKNGEPVMASVLGWDYKDYIVCLSTIAVVVRTAAGAEVGGNDRSFTVVRGNLWFKCCL